MFLLRAKNNYGDKKQPRVPEIPKFNCLYISSVELFMDVGQDQSAMKKTVARTVGNLDLKTVTGEPVQILLNETGIIVQEHKYKDPSANVVLMAHALKRICFTTSFPKKRLYVFVSRLPQEERIFAHFFLMQDKSSGDKIIQELTKAFTNAYKTKKRRTLEKDQRRNLRSQHPVAPPQAQTRTEAKTQAHTPKAQASPAKRKEKFQPLSQFQPPPPYADVLSEQEQILQQYDITSPTEVPSAPPLFSYPIPALPQQHLPFDLPPQAPALFRHDRFAPQPAVPAYTQDPFLPQLSPNYYQLDPFSQFEPPLQAPNQRPHSTFQESDGLPSYNSYNKASDPTFQVERMVSKDELLIDLSSPDHIPPTTKLTRSLSTSNMLDEVRDSSPLSPPIMPPALNIPNHPDAALPAFRSRIGNETASRPKSGIYPSLSSGFERGAGSPQSFDDNDFNANGYSHLQEDYELQNEPWYQQGLPRDIIIEILQSQKEGAFFIRESLSQPGKWALSVRDKSSVQHYLIIKSRNGYQLENDKIFFPSISRLVTHHSINRGVLPCTLAVGDSNPSYLRDDNLESSDSEAEGENPLYTSHALTGSMNVQHH